MSNRSGKRKVDTSTSADKRLKSNELAVVPVVAAAAAVSSAARSPTVVAGVTLGHAILDLIVPVLEKWIPFDKVQHRDYTPVYMILHDYMSDQVIDGAIQALDPETRSNTARVTFELWSYLWRFPMHEVSANCLLPYNDNGLHAFQQSLSTPPIPITPLIGSSFANLTMTSRKAVIRELECTMIVNPSSRLSLQKAYDMLSTLPFDSPELKNAELTVRSYFLGGCVDSVTRACFRTAPLIRDAILFESADISRAVAELLTDSIDGSEELKGHDLATVALVYYRALRTGNTRVREFVHDNFSASVNILDSLAGEAWLFTMGVKKPTRVLSHTVFMKNLTRLTEAGFNPPASLSFPLLRLQREESDHDRLWDECLNTMMKLHPTEGMQFLLKQPFLTYTSFPTEVFRAFTLDIFDAMNCVVDKGLWIRIFVESPNVYMNDTVLKELIRRILTAEASDLSLPLTDEDAVIPDWRLWRFTMATETYPRIREFLAKSKVSIVID